MKGWLVGLALTAVIVASGVGLWITWDSTQPTPADSIAAGADRLVTPTTATLAPVTTTTTMPLPDCTPGSETVADDPEADWATIVIDRTHGLPEDFVPSDLVEVVEAGFDTRDQVRRIVIDDLAALRTAAEANGIPIVVISGYRSFSYQRQLFQDRVGEVGEDAAAASIARPGHSEHQLGTAIDVLGPEGGELTTDFGATPAGEWLEANAHEFGFIISYPDGGSDLTCFEYEPWHLRYVGRDIAAEIVESGLAPREWMLARRAAEAG